MKLRHADGRVTENPKLSQIENAIREMKDIDDAFVILERTPTTYMQAAGNRKAGFLLEHQVDDTDQHFAGTKGRYEEREVIEAMKSYATNDEWKTTIEWRPMEIKSKKGCAAPTAAMIAVSLVVGSIILLA